MLSNYFKRINITLWRSSGYDADNPYSEFYITPISIQARYKDNYTNSRGEEAREDAEITTFVVNYADIKKGDFIAIGKHSDLSPISTAQKISRIMKSSLSSDIMIEVAS